MKLLTIAATLSILFACGVLIYTEWEKQHALEDAPKKPIGDSTEPVKTQAFPVQPPKAEQKTQLHPRLTFEQTEDRNDQTGSHPEPSAPDWLDTQPPPEHSSDPLGDMLDKEQVKARGAYIEDPETLELDELIAAERQQVIERFGDIPAVSLYTSLKPKYLLGKLHVDEKITF